MRIPVSRTVHILICTTLKNILMPCASMTDRRTESSGIKKSVSLHDTSLRDTAIGSVAAVMQRQLNENLSLAKDDRKKQRFLTIYSW